MPANSFRYGLSALCALARPQQQHQPAEGNLLANPGLKDFRPFPETGAGPAWLPRLAVYPRAGRG